MAVILDSFYNVDTQRFCDSDGSPLALEQLPRITLEQQAVLALTCIKDDGAPATFTVNDTFSWAADDDWDSDSSVLMQTTDARINDGSDWADADPAAGRIGIRVDADTANLQAALGTAEELLVHGELKAYAMGASKPYYVGQMDFYARNLVDHAGVTPPPVPSSYYSKSEIDSLLTTCLAQAPTSAEATIVSGAATVTSAFTPIDTEGDAASDDLVTIDGSTGFKLLFLWPASASRAVTLKHGTGNILTADGADYTLPANAMTLLVYDGSNWRVIRDASALTANDLDMNSNKITNLADGTSAQDAATYGQLAAALQGIDWLESVLDQIDFTSDEPASPTTGDRYINTVTGTSSSTSQSVTANYVYEWSGSTWTETAVNLGATSLDENLGQFVRFNNTAWVNMGTGIDHNSLLNLTTGNPHTQYMLKSQNLDDVVDKATARGNIAVPGDADDNVLSGKNSYTSEFSLDGIISPSAIATSQDNYNPTGLDAANVLRLSADAAVNLTGLVAPTSGKGAVKLIHNIGATYTITLIDASASSTAANRFTLSDDLVIQPGGMAMAWYDPTSTRWRAMPIGGSGITWGSIAGTLADQTDLAARTIDTDKTGLSSADDKKLLHATVGLSFGASNIDAQLPSIGGIWKLDETSGNRVDAINSYAMVDNNTVGYTTGKDGNGADFVRANSEYLRLQTSTYDFNAVAATRTFALAFWFKGSADTKVTGSQRAFAMDGNGTNSGGFSAYLNGSGQIVFRTFNSSSVTSTLTSSTDICDGAWHHVVISYSGGSGTLYIDGSSESTGSASAVGDIGSDLILAAGFPDAVSNYADISLDEWILASAALTVSSAGELYNSGTGRFVESTEQYVASSRKSTEIPYPAAGGGTADALTVSLTPTATEYAQWMTIVVEPTATNTGAATINVNSLGAKSIKLQDGTDPIAGHLQAGGIHTLVYDGTNFILLNPWHLTSRWTGGPSALDVYDDNLLAFFNFEGDVSIAQSDIKGGNWATVEGTPTRSQGAKGAAATCPDNAGYQVTNTPTDFAATWTSGSFTFAMVSKINNALGRAFAGNHDGSGDGWWLVETSGSIEWRNKPTGGGADETVTGTTTIDDDAWHLIVVTVGGGTAKLYIDGTQEGGDLSISSIVASGNLGLAGYVNSSGTFTDIVSAAADLHLNHVAIWDTPLSAAAITALYNSGDFRIWR